ncbi:hypothetical protein BT69DRAFT_1113189 [Atractiella rhizophila]|nr:hypothetical protein BT69DRAFT_1113189 [Atractiella rhizophila]
MHYLTFAIFVGVSRDRNPFAGPTLGLDPKAWKRGHWREEDVRGGWEVRNVRERRIGDTVVIEEEEEDEDGELFDEPVDDDEREDETGATERSPLLEGGLGHMRDISTEESDSESDPDEIVDIPEPSPISIKPAREGTSTSAVGSLGESLRSKRSRISLRGTGRTREESRERTTSIVGSPKRERGYGSFVGI